MEKGEPSASVTRRHNNSKKEEGDSSSSIIMKKPQYSKFWQQESRSYKPRLTPAMIVAVFAVIGAVFIPIGVVEIVDHYDSDCVPANFRDNKVGFIQSTNTSKTCIRKISVRKLMKSPVFVYYELHGFHQNHLRYAKDKSNKQLRSKVYEDETKTCKHEIFNANNRRIVPCGLIAWSLFNDTYAFYVNNSLINVNKTDIAWKSDRKSKFGKDVFPKNFQGGGLIGGAKLNASKPLSEHEDLMVWMRLAALPNFRKIYGRIETDLEANQTITVVIQNNYNSYSFKGKKKLVLSTTSWLGGKHQFLGFLCIAVGGLCLVLSLFFFCAFYFKNNKNTLPTSHKNKLVTWNSNWLANLLESYYKFHEYSYPWHKIY
ncbi:hypothetical protein MKX03_028809 [Papaver bracteatum]|nr:hypothetical protein MKX03_028809 [Papaver bracteatum]